MAAGPWGHIAYHYDARGVLFRDADLNISAAETDSESAILVQCPHPMRVGDTRKSISTESAAKDMVSDAKHA